MEIIIVMGLLLSLFSLYSFTIKAEYGMIGIMIMSLINCWFITLPTVKIGLNLYLFDPIFIIIFISTLVRLGFLQQYRYTSPIWILFGILIFISLILGLKDSGTVAGVDFRGYFYYWAGTLYFMSFHYSKDLLEKILKIWFWIGIVFLTITYFRFVAEALHLPMSQEWIKDDPTGVKFRVIKSNHAYLLGVTVVMLFLRHLIPEAKKPSKPITVLFMLAVIVLQHRSVWMATMTAILSATLLPGIKTHKMITNFIIIGIVGAILLTPLIFSKYGEIIFSSVNSLAEKGTHLNTGTFGDRVKGWNFVLQNWVKLPFVNQIFGEPMGAGVGGVKVNIHSFYIQFLARVGLAGILIILLFYISLLTKLYLKNRQYPEDKLYFSLFFMLLIGQLVFYIPYANQAEHSIILGIAASITIRGLAISNASKNKVVENSQYFLNTPNINQVRKLI